MAIKMPPFIDSFAFGFFIWVSPRYGRESVGSKWKCTAGTRARAAASGGWGVSGKEHRSPPINIDECRRTERGKY
jgi:hypothetical protein